MKKSLLFLVLFLTVLCVRAQPLGYYANALGKNGVLLQTSLKNIIDNHSMKTYPLWSYFSNTDNKGSNKIWDMYSDKPVGTASYTYTIGQDQCGQYNSEGDCYNHEHVWPKSYYNDASPMESDLHHIVPTDGWVNNKRAAFPLGDVNNTSYTSSNGTKLGTSATYAGYNGNVFEPIDEFKGDFARMVFYTSTRYKGEDNSWNNWEMASGAVLTADAAAILLQWHNADTVSQKEIDRNNAIYTIQGNRNPFIDYPVFADCIWGTSDCQPLDVADVIFYGVKVFPNPVTDQLQIILPSSLKQRDFKFEVYNSFGQKVISTSQAEINISQLSVGFYTLRLSTLERYKSFSFVKKQN